jgi:hypothetical protein
VILAPEAYASRERRLAERWKRIQFRPCDCCCVWQVRIAGFQTGASLASSQDAIARVQNPLVESQAGKSTDASTSRSLSVAETGFELLHRCHGPWARGLLLGWSAKIDWDLQLAALGLLLSSAAGSPIRQRSCLPEPSSSLKLSFMLLALRTVNEVRNLYSTPLCLWHGRGRR